MLKKTVKASFEFDRRVWLLLFAMLAFALVEDFAGYLAVSVAAGLAGSSMFDAAALAATG